MAKRQGTTEDKPAPVSAENKALNNAISQIEKTFGAGSIMKLGDGSHLEVEGISTGALSLDLALGGKGLPRGRIVELFGPESSGKTTIALHAVANAQRNGGVAAFIDAEHALDPSWCKRLGVDIEALLVSQPSSAEEALQIAEMLVLSNAVDIVVIDSVAALVPRAEIEGEIGDSHVGLQARLMSQALRKLTGGVSRSKCVLIFINQLREKIGVMFGSPETTPGGRALKFYSSARIDVRRIGPVKDGEEVTGSRVKAKVVKNKVAPPFRVCEFDMMYTHGISREGDILDLAIADKLVEKSGSWFNHGDLRLGQGRENAKQYLRDHPELADEISAKIIANRSGHAPTFSANGASMTRPAKMLRAALIGATDFSSDAVAGTGLVVTDFPGIACILDGDRSGAEESVSPQTFGRTSRPSRGQPAGRAAVADSEVSGTMTPGWESATGKRVLIRP